MALMRIIYRSILQKPTKSSPRWFSTVRETPKFVNQPGKKRLLYDKVKANPKSNITDIMNEWVNRGNPVKRFDFINLINYFRSGKYYQSALELYDWMENNKFGITNGDAAIRIDLLCKTEGLASAEKYFNSLPDSEKTNKTYGALLSCYCREKVFNKALEVFEKLKALNYMSCLNYNNVLLLYLSIGQPDKVLSVVQDMDQKQITPDRYTYNLLIDSYAALKDFDAIEEILTRMRTNNVKSGSFTYTNLATIYFNGGLQEKAKSCLEVLEKMQDIPREEVFEACRTRLKLYADMNDLSGVNRAWETLKSTFPTPNNTAHLFMLLALSKLGELDSLEKLFKEWEDGCSVYDIRLANVMLEFYLGHNMIEKASALFESLLARGVGPSLKTQDLFATLCMKTGQIDLALDYLEMGVDKAGTMNRDWFPTDETVNLFLNYFKEKNDVDRAEKFTQIMKKVNRLDSKLFDSLLSNGEASIVGV